MPDRTAYYQQASSIDPGRHQFSTACISTSNGSRVSCTLVGTIPLATGGTCQPWTIVPFGGLPEIQIEMSYFDIITLRQPTVQRPGVTHQGRTAPDTRGAVSIKADPQLNALQGFTHIVSQDPHQVAKPLLEESQDPAAHPPPYQTCEYVWTGVQ